MIKTLSSLFDGRKLLAEYVATSDVTTMSIPILAEDNDRGYDIEVILKNGSASSSTMNLYVNGISTATSYYTCTFYYSASNTFVGNRYNSSDMCNSCSAGAAFTAFGRIYRNHNGNFLGALHATYNSPSTSITSLLDQSLSIMGPVISKITSIQVTASVANAIAAGSTLRVLRKG